MASDPTASPKQPPRFLAHSANDEGTGVEELLQDHLRLVATRAADFAQSFGAYQQAFAAGLVHDLGKYADQFQRRLKDPREPGRDHWSVGAALLVAAARSLGLIPALAIAGHHTGLGIIPAGTDPPATFGEELRCAFSERQDHFSSAAPLALDALTG